jgi:hypothetical protein
MARPKKLIPSYRKHGASRQAVVNICGKTVYLGPLGTDVSKCEYDRVIAEWLARGRAPEPTVESATSIKILCARYLDFAIGYCQKNGRCTKVAPGIKATIRY